MKKILMLVLTIFLGALLVGCTGKAKPLATNEEIKNFTVLTAEEKADFLDKADKKTYDTIKLTLSVKSKMTEIIKQTVETIAEMHISKDKKTMYVSYKKANVITGDKKTGMDFSLTGDMYLEDGTVYIKVNGKSYVYVDGNSNKTEINQKIKFAGNAPFVDMVSLLDIAGSFAKIKEVKKSPNGKLFVSVIDDDVKLFFNADFELVQFTLGDENNYIIFDIRRTNAEVPKLTEAEKNTYKEDSLFIPKIE